MDNWTFGLTMIVVGMGGTITALSVLALLMGLLKRLFPAESAQPPDFGRNRSRKKETIGNGKDGTSPCKRRLSMR